MKLLSNKEEDNPWVSISDLMSVLMIIFLFISVSYMLKVSVEKQRIEKIAVTYENLQQDLFQEMTKEFEKDLSEWDATIDAATLSIRFENPEILFGTGSSELKEHFKEILNDFFPRFLNILTNPKYKNDIEEIRIEGHTSSEWMGEPSSQQAYFNNMELSQDRTRNVLEYLLKREQNDSILDWIRQHLTANGLSSSKLVLNPDGSENKEKSRRVEFRVKTNAEKRIVNILEVDSPN